MKRPLFQYLQSKHSEATVNKRQKGKTCRKGSKLTIFVTAFNINTHTETLDFNYSLSLTNLIFRQQLDVSRLTWPLSLPTNPAPTSAREIGGEESMLFKELCTLASPWTYGYTSQIKHPQLHQDWKKKKMSFIEPTRLRGGVVCVCWSVSSTLFLSR